jgi:hypothetical protein
MNKTYFPALDEFYDKFTNAVTQSGIEQNFIKKWGLERLADVYDILNNNVQGGYASHKHTMLSASTGDSVLNVGPGMGFCVFLLTELFERVPVAEPDMENCALLASIANHYVTHKGKNAHEIVKVYHAGIAITQEAVNYWNTKQELMKKRNLKGSILNFSIQGAGQLKDFLEEKVSRVYLHKVLSSLSISTNFETVISECRLFLKEGGEITWSEPQYIFDDILQLNGKQSLNRVLKPIFEKNNLHFQIENYQLTNKSEETTPGNIESWTLIKAALNPKMEEEP